MEDALRRASRSGYAEQLQGCLAHETPPPRRTLPSPCAWGPMVIPGGWVFLMREFPLQSA